MSDANLNKQPQMPAAGDVSRDDRTPSVTSGSTAKGTGRERLARLLGANASLPLLLAGAAAITLVVVVFLWAGGDSYRVLFNNLSDADGGSIINELDARGVPYRLGAGGQAILVPADQVHLLRLQLAEQGLPRAGNVGFELMDNQAFGISQFAEQVNYQRSLEGELASSMQAMNPVSSARVHLSMAKPSAFIRDREPAKASVILTLHPGRALSEGQVNAISHLVSSSVPDLSTENVTVVDQAGNLLTGNNGNRLDGDNLTYIQEVERHYQSRIENILTPLFGDSNFRIQVAADMDFSLREETQESYQPNQGTGEAAVRSAQISGLTNAAEALSRGIPGALSNSPPGWAPPVLDEADAQAAGDAATLAGTREAGNDYQYDNLINYEVGRNITHIQHQQGRIERLSVAAVINYQPGLDADGDPALMPLSDTRMEEVTELIRQAMGFSAIRGDQLQVVNSPFSASYQEVVPEPEWWTTPEGERMVLGLGRYLLAALFALTVFIVILRPLFKRQLAVYEATSPALTRQDMELATDQSEQRALPNPRKRRERQASNYELELKEVRQLAKDDPRLIAMVVRSWMTSNG